MFLVSVTCVNAFAIVAYGLSKVPAPSSSSPSVDTTSNTDGSITLRTNSEGPGVAVTVTVPSVAGGVKVTEASLSTIVTVVASRLPAVTAKSKLYSGMVSSRVRFSSPSVPTNCTAMSAVVPTYTGSEAVDNSTIVQ